MKEESYQGRTNMIDLISHLTFYCIAFPSLFSWQVKDRLNIIKLLHNNTMQERVNEYLKHQLLYFIRALSIVLYAFYRPYVQCDYCLDWFHVDCVGITREEAKRIPAYYCPKCEKKKKIITKR